MVAIGFSVLKEEILQGKKRQTIRLDSKKWTRVLDKFIAGIPQKLQLYWHLRQKDCELIKEEKLKSIFFTYLSLITEEQAKDDGFATLDDLKGWFLARYPTYDFMLKGLFIIRW